MKINREEDTDWIIKYFSNLSLLFLLGALSFFGDTRINETVLTSKSVHRMIQEFLLNNNSTEDTIKKAASPISVVIFSI
jgi:hypothetical protein